MKRYNADILSEITGLSMIGATLDVLVEGTETRVTLYAADDETGATVNQPVPNGTAFYVPDGRYDIRARNGGKTRVIPAVDMFDGFAQNRRLEAVENGEPMAPGSLRSDLNGATGTQRIGYAERGLKLKLEDTIAAVDRGVLPGLGDATAYLQAAIDEAATGSREVLLPEGSILVDAFTVRPGVTLRGRGQGRTTLLRKPGSSGPMIRNFDQTRTNQGIALLDFTIDGNHAMQSVAANGVLMDKAGGGRFRLEIKNCRGMGLVLSQSDANVFDPEMYIHGCGKLQAGYGLYMYCSSDNLVNGGRYEDCCIGIAVEASGASLYSRRNRIVEAACNGNRADFGQSGAGIHFEQSDGADCSGCSVVGGSASSGTGVGINNTAVHGLKITGTRVEGNGGTGVASLSAFGVDYQGLSVRYNGQNAFAGYRCNVRFDDQGLSGSNGRLAGCIIEGAAADGSVRTSSSTSSMRIERNFVTGAAIPYVVTGAGDFVDKVDRGVFPATLLGTTAPAPVANVRWAIDGDVVTLEFADLRGTSGSTVATVTGAPEFLYPAATRKVAAVLQDNGQDIVGRVEIAPNAVMTLRAAGVGDFVGSGTKGVPAGSTITYRL